MDEPLKTTETRYKGSFYYFLSDNKRMLIQVIGICLLLLLLFPFYKTFLISVIFYAGFIETRRMVRKLPPAKKWLFRIIFYSVICGFFLVFYWIIDKVTQSSILFSKEGARKNLFERFEILYNSNIDVIEGWFVNIFPGLNKSDVHDQFIQGMQSFFETSFNWTIDFFSDLPMLGLQICFFITVLIWFSHSRGKTFNYFNSILCKHLSQRQVRGLCILIEECSFQTLICTFLVSFVQAGILGIAAIALGLSGWPIIFFVGFIFSFFPVVGTLPASLMGIALAYSHDGVASAALFTGAALVTSVADNFLRTWLISAQESVTPSSFNFFAIIGGIAMFGFSGVLIGPFVLVFATTLLKKSET